VLNFFAPAVVVACFTAGAAKLVWRKTLHATSWWRLSGWATVGNALALIGALVVFGRDGKMAGYGLMVLACGLSLWGVMLKARSG
jgi:hypothetical protein